MKRSEIIFANPISDFVRRRGHELKRVGENFVTSGCPKTPHKRGHRPVMIYPKTQSWSCHDCKRGGSVIDWVMIEKNVTAADAMRELGGEQNGNEERSKTKRLIQAIYDYRDTNGNLVSQTVRYLPKGFSQRRPDGKGGWIWNLDGVETVLFRLPEITRDIRGGLRIFVVEGEKDVLAMEERGLSATCNPMGANKWRDSYSETLRGADVIIIADKDEEGQKHVQLVASEIHGVAKFVRVLELPDVNGAAVKDPYDYFAAGGHAQQLVALADNAPEWKREAAPDLSSLLSRCETGFKNNITFVSDHVPVVLAIWAAHTHCVQYFNRTPYLSISSPTKRCGKSNLLSCLAKVCARAWYSISPSVAVLFRKIERDMPTLLLDEADRCFADGEDSDHDMLAILNSGYKRGGTVDRCGGPNKTDLESFNVFCPKAFAGIGRLPDTTEDRCLPIRMERQPKHSKRFLEEVVAAKLSPIRDGFEKWARPALKDELAFDIPEKDFPDSIGDRAVEVCEPLFKIAKLAGGDWYKRIREATAAICGSEEDQDKSVLRLAAIREAFRSDEFVTSTELIDRIREQDDPPFPDWWFKKDVDHAAMGRSLSRMLKPFKVKPERDYINGERVRGYKRHRLESVWSAYL